jgi:hypothetical protein
MFNIQNVHKKSHFKNINRGAKVLNKKDRLNILGSGIAIQTV